MGDVWKGIACNTPFLLNVVMNAKVYRINGRLDKQSFLHNEPCNMGNWSDPEFGVPMTAQVEFLGYDELQHGKGPGPIYLKAPCPPVSLS